MRRFATLGISRGLKRVSPARAAWVVGLIAQQDRMLMLVAWREAMAFDSRRRLAEIRCPTLVVAGSDDDAVPMHHARLLHDGIAGSQPVVVAHADHALIWTHADELVRVVDGFLGGEPHATA